MIHKFLVYLTKKISTNPNRLMKETIKTPGNAIKDRNDLPPILISTSKVFVNLMTISKEARL